MPILSLYCPTCTSQEPHRTKGNEAGSADHGEREKQYQIMTCTTCGTSQKVALGEGGADFQANVDA